MAFGDPAIVADSPEAHKNKQYDAQYDVLELSETPDIELKIRILLVCLPCPCSDSGVQGRIFTQISERLPVLLDDWEVNRYIPFTVKGNV